MRTHQIERNDRSLRQDVGEHARALHGDAVVVHVQLLQCRIDLQSAGDVLDAIVADFVLCTV